MGDKERDIPPCKNGVQANGETCPACGGSGIDQAMHTTSTDLVVFPLPRKEGDPVLDPSKAMHTFSPPMDLVRFMVEYCDRLTEKAKGAVFPSQAIARSKNTMDSGGTDGGGDTTATEQDYSWDSVYDAYRPFTGKYSYAWLFFTKMIAIYTDNFKGFTNYHKFPSDYKLKPVGILMDEAGKAKTSDLPQHVLQAIHDDIANIYYADDPDTLTKIQIKNKFHPFSGKSESETRTILSSEDILPYYKVLYNYFDVIFQEIDEELGDKFYLMTYEKQKAEIERRVQVLITEIEKLKAKTLKETQAQQAAGFFDNRK
jgi:hypothetical protein